jgi:predicted nucleotidyltransferase
MKNDIQSITRIKAVYNALGDLQDKVVFVGGAVVALYADREILYPRPTNDVDVIVEVLNYKDHAALEGKLHQKGFVNDQDSGMACRYKVQGIIVDIMPTKDRSFGFDSMWYEPGFQNAVSYTVDDKHIIRILTAPYYLATKLEAFRERGKGDGRTSQDFEDIVFVFENRATIWDEIRSSDEALNGFLRFEFIQLLSERHISEWIYSHTEGGDDNVVDHILKSMRDLIEH